MKAFLAAILLSLSAFAGEPYAFRITCTSEEPGKTIYHFGLSAPVKADGKKRILTALHTIKFNAAVTDILVDYPEGWIRCKVVKQDEKLDLCLLEPAIEPPFTLSVAKTSPKAEDTVINPNFLKERKMTMQEGKINGTVETVDGTMLMGTIPYFSHGSSGGPIIKDGKLVGIGVAGLSKDGGVTIDIALFISPEKINEFLKK